MQSLSLSTDIVIHRFPTCMKVVRTEQVSESNDGVNEAMWLVGGSVKYVPEGDSSCYVCYVISTFCH